MVGFICKEHKIGDCVLCLKNEIAVLQEEIVELKAENKRLEEELEDWKEYGCETRGIQ